MAECPEDCDIVMDHEHDEVVVTAEVDPGVTIKLLRQALEKSRNEAEQLRVKLAGCGTAALGYCRDGKPGQECHQGMYGWSVALEDVKKLYEAYDARTTALSRLYDLNDQDTYVNATRTRPTAEEWGMAWQRAGETLGRIGGPSQEAPRT